MNRLPRGPRAGETPREYTQRLSEAIGALRAPRFITSDSQTGTGPFGESELRGMRIFFKAGVGNAQKTGAGNCAECHTPPAFTDFAFHNTGAAQDEYDAVHGAGAFMSLRIPSLHERTPDQLPATWQHPAARGLMRSVAIADDPELMDLGVWNVYGNPNYPGVQARFESLLNRARQLPADAVLTRTIGLFKTSTVRNLSSSPPYLHTGRTATLVDVVRFYVRMSSLAHRGAMRNAPPEFYSMRLGSDDVEPLVRFLEALNQP